MTSTHMDCNLTRVVHKGSVPVIWLFVRSLFEVRQQKRAERDGKDQQHRESSQVNQGRESYLQVVNRQTDRNDCVVQIGRASCRERV